MDRQLLNAPIKVPQQRFSNATPAPVIKPHFMRGAILFSLL